ncbi:DUF3108 domain-containing protein, partial [Candidatus Falkowbacteria bacterium]|nr:DUF3108 domain-containing protein [Candidatus Falkowbacteria bacterium]
MTAVPTLSVLITGLALALAQPALADQSDRIVFDVVLKGI